MPCGVGYHQACIRVGPPFTCRRRDSRGLSFPIMPSWPYFICECCTVRSVLDRELGGTRDSDLLRLERMRILDFANSWARSTYASYNSKLRFLRTFESLYPGLQLLSSPALIRPPREACIALAWAEEAFSLRPSPDPERVTVTFNTTRQLRSAAGWYDTVSRLLGSPGGYFYDDHQQKLLEGRTGINDSAVVGRFTKGLQGRLGDESRPAWALRDRHIRSFDAFFDLNYRQARTHGEKRHWALAGMANLFLWLGWLRSSELFSLRVMDVECVRPFEGPAHDLPPGVGALLLRLKEETKTNRFSTADVPIAYQTLSGLQPGRWYQRFLRHRPMAQGTGDDPRFLFQSDTGFIWDSFYYRHEFIYPLLFRLQREGDPVLTALRGQTPGNTIPAKYWSLHMYRRGSRSHCDRVAPNEPVRRKATLVEQYEHARWRRKRSGEAIDVMYRVWPLYDRLQLTLCCM